MSALTNETDEAYKTIFHSSISASFYIFFLLIFLFWLNIFGCFVLLRGQVSQCFIELNFCFAVLVIHFQLQNLDPVIVQYTPHIYTYMHVWLYVCVCVCLYEYGSTAWLPSYSTAMQKCYSNMVFLGLLLVGKSLTDFTQTTKMKLLNSTLFY